MASILMVIFKTVCGSCRVALAIVALPLLLSPSIFAGENQSARAQFYSRYFGGGISDAVRTLGNSEVVVLGRLKVQVEGLKDVPVSATSGMIQTETLLYGFASPPKQIPFLRPAGRNFVFSESKLGATFYGWDNPAESDVPVIAFLNRVDGDWSLLKVIPAEAKGSDGFVEDLKLLQKLGLRKGVSLPAQLPFDRELHPFAAAVAGRLKPSN